ncbi:MAG TPA: hypothetical protein VFW76_04610 [Ktedonobacterales bacterium]|nr:hypothetical protein [Ktedonobacterales bacterium]
MAMERYPARSPQRQRVAAWIAFALALVYPVTVAWIAFTLPSLELSDGGVLVILFQSIYGSLVCFVWPLPIIATYLAILVLMDAGGGNKIAWTAIVISALSLLAIASVVIGLKFFIHFQ